MKYRPILFSGAMVRALLADTKTQTRRILKPQPFNGRPDDEVHKQMIENGALGQDESLTDLLNGAIDHGFIPEAKCPYGQPGDRLWVRETFAHHVQAIGSKHDEDGPFVYAADGEFAKQYRLGNKWKPSIFMPRWASRITLEITNIRVERLQDISEEDARAEGCWALGDCECTAKRQYQELWESINGKGSWDANPWVWVVEFRRIKP